MRRAVTATAAVVAALVGATVASAKAPKPGDLPSVEEIYQGAKAAQDAQKAGAAAKHDPLKDAIDGYREPTKTKLTDFKALVDCLNDPKETPEHRNDAASALIERFGKENTSDAEVRATRRMIATAIIDLMKADKAKDEVGLGAIERVFYAVSWYRQKMYELKFHAADKPIARAAAWQKMKKFLEKGQD